MILKNLKNYMKALHAIGGGIITDRLESQITNACYMIHTSSSTGNPMDYHLYPPYMEQPLPYLNSSILTSETETGNYDVFYVGFGSGNTEVTEDDYKLESFISSGLSLVSSSCSGTVVMDADKNGSTRTCAVEMIIKNTSTENLTIAEIGFYQTIFYSKNSYYNFLLHREVLDSPVVMEPNSTLTLAFDFSFTHRIAS